MRHVNILIYELNTILKFAGQMILVEKERNETCYRYEGRRKRACTACIDLIYRYLNREFKIAKLVVAKYYKY